MQNNSLRYGQDFFSRLLHFVVLFWHCCVESMVRIKMGFCNNIFEREIERERERERENYCIGSREMIPLLVEHIRYSKNHVVWQLWCEV